MKNKLIYVIFFTFNGHEIWICFWTVFWICGILVRVRIWIRGSAPLTNLSGCSYFVSDLQDGN
jgi:hypothetical protein